MVSINKRVIVVGAGLAGLAAAICVAGSYFLLARDLLHNRQLWVF